MDVFERHRTEATDPGQPAMVKTVASEKNPKIVLARVRIRNLREDCFHLGAEGL